MPECVICREAITHPICMECLQAEMEAWLQETRPELIAELQERAEELWYPFGEVNCLLCKHPMDVCTYCFTKHILDWIGQYPELVPQYLKFFNYDLHYNGYSKELLAV